MSTDKITGFKLQETDGTDNNDKLTGSNRDDKLVGHNGNDKLLGKDGNDRLDGGDGNDFLDGGKGNNILVGGKGKDIFSLHRGSGFDKIKDFKIGEDHIKLGAGVGFQNLTLTQRGNDTLISTGGDQLAVLKGIRPDQVTASDFKP